MSITRELSAFLTQVSYADILPQNLDHAEILISSTVAGAACGSSIESSKIMRALVIERGGKPDASIWVVSGDKLPVASAALVNAVIRGCGIAHDSVDLRNIVHAGTPLVSTSLAIAERTAGDRREPRGRIVLVASSR
jgi:2-methylcitrate dehydratase PrpD